MCTFFYDIDYGSIKISKAPNNTVVLLNISNKTCGHHYDDKETMCSKYLFRKEGHFKTHKI